jgi:YidC/Oxa1 family membrane protein insertase
MDRNTIIGLVMIGLILSVFTIYNQPTEEEIKKQQQELALKEKKEKEEKKAEKKEAETPVSSNVSDTTQAKVASSENKGELVYLENDKLKIFFSTKGGQVAAVYLKEYRTYEDYRDKKDNAMRLFSEGDASNQLIIPLKDKTLKTANYIFSVTNKDDKSIEFTADLGDGKTVAQSYQLNDNKYEIGYDVKVKGFGGEVDPKNVLLHWDVAYRKTERLFSEQRRVSTICMKYDQEGFDYLSEMGSDDSEAEDKVKWVAYKQSYFSSILKPENGFAKEGSSFVVKTYNEGDKKNSSHLKDFSSSLNPGFKNVSDATVSFNWYFGPNDYEVLRSYDKEYDEILNFGWGLFRWINVYAVQPMFNLLVDSGLSLGLAILLLTLIIKLILVPVQWKMFVSSAKMRIMKPEIDELNAKYPEKDDAMKKQMEMMTLYRESGASPLSGCVPMLIQMPILLAVFRFFPAAFELRQKSFLWAEDLSSYDSIWDFGVYIWPYGDHMSLFTLLMAGTTLVYTVMNSGNMQQPQQPGMPNMKVIMYIFPIMMIFFFNNYSSGLSYYYFISTLISILIMVLIKNFFVDEEKLKLKMAERKANNASNPKEKKKSKFQEKLEQMQKMQQEQLKNKKKK